MSAITLTNMLQILRETRVGKDSTITLDYQETTKGCYRLVALEWYADGREYSHIDREFTNYSEGLEYYHAFEPVNNPQSVLRGMLSIKEADETGYSAWCLDMNVLWKSNKTINIPFVAPYTSKGGYALNDETTKELEE